MPDNEQVVRDAYEAFARGDVPAVVATVDEGVEWDSTEALPQGGSYRGKQGVGEFFQAVGGAWTELQIDLTDLIAAGEHVVGVGRGEGTLAAGGHGRLRLRAGVHAARREDRSLPRVADPDQALR